MFQFFSPDGIDSLVLWHSVSQYGWAFLSIFFIAAAYYLGRRTAPQPADVHPVFEQLEQAILGVALNGTVVGWNAQALEQLGCTSVALHGRPVRDLFPDSEQGIIGRVVGKASVGAEEPETAVTIRCGEQTRRILLRCVLDDDPRRRDVAFWLILRNETQLDRLRDDLARHEQIEQLAAEAGRLHWAVWDVRSEQIETQPSFRATYAPDHADACTTVEHWLDLFEPEDVPSIRKAVDDLVDGSYATAICDVRIRSGSQEGRWLQIHARVLERDAHHLPTRLVLLMVDVHDVRSATDAVRENERRFQDFFEQSAIGMASVDRDGYCVMVNQALARMLGYPIEEMVGRKIADFTHPDDNRKSAEYLQQILAGGNDYSLLEKRYLHCDGSIVHAEVRAAPVCDEEGSVSSIVATIVDVTDRKRYEEAVIESRERLEMALDATRLGVWEWSRHANDLVYASESFRRILGVAEDDDCSWRQWRERFHPEESERVLGLFKPLFLGDVDLLETELRICVGEGEHRWVRIRAKACDQQREDRDHRIIGTCQDITVMKRVDEALRENEERYRGIYETSLMGIFRLTRDGQVVSCNPAFARVLGYESPDECITAVDNIFGRHGRAGGSGAETLLEAIAKRGSVAGHETSLRDVNGNTVHVSLSAKATYIADGQVAYFDGTIEDISARKLAEERLLQATRQAEAASSAKTHFLANMSHEIRTPMTAILGYVEVMRQETLDDAKRREFLDIIDRNGKHLLELINDILDLSKIEAGRIQLETEECSLPELLADVVRSVDIRAKEKGVELATRLRNEVPEKISVDGYRLRQVLLNLAGNAVKFTREGSVTIEVAALDDGLPPGRTVLELAVEDTGVGIEESRLASIFDPFTQADSSTSRQYGGTGLGLAIVARIVEQMGGETYVESQLGRGSRFTVRVPVEYDADAERIVSAAVAPAESPDEPKDWAPNKLNGVRVLVAEDGIDNQRLIGLLLRKAGAEVQVVENGSLAVSRALDDPPDVILMDIQMPIMDGYEATRRLRRENYAGPIVALTAHAMSHDVDKCREAGCDEYLRKPIDREALIRLLARLSGRGTVVMSDVRP